MIEADTFRLITGSAHELPLPDASVHAIITSPPYFGLRAYDGEQTVEWPAVEYAPMPGLAPLAIPGCDAACAHEWAAEGRIAGNNKPSDKSTLQRHGTDGRLPYLDVQTGKAIESAYCRKCGGWRGALGHEPTIEAYVGHLILCLREWRRVLRDDGTCWVNLGDSYAGSGKGQMGDGSASDRRGAKRGTNGGTLTGGLPTGVPAGLKSKDLFMVPARFALAAQADGWYLRSDIIWSKPNPMPESVTDRPTKAHEYIFLLARRERYFYDADAIREPNTWPDHNRFGNKNAEARRVKQLTGNMRPDAPEHTDRVGRNRRSVWTVATRPYSAAHFAVWPPALVEPMVKAATSEHGVCGTCGAPWVRVVEREPMVINRSERREQMGEYGRTQASGTMVKPAESKTVGFRPTCEHDAAPVPATVLDPFSGSGATGEAAISLGRYYIGVDIYGDYHTDHAIARCTPQRKLL